VRYTVGQMARLTLSRLSVLTSVTTLAVVWATACSSDDSKSSSGSDSNGNNAGPTTATMGGPTTGGPGNTSGGTNNAGPNTSAGPNSTGAGSQGTTQGTQGTTGAGNVTSGGNSTGAGGGSGNGTEGGPATGGGTGGGTTGTTGGGDGTSADCSAAEGDIPALKLTEFATGINVPVDIAYPPGDDRLFVITLDGNVRIIKDGQVVEEPFLSLGNKVVVGGALGNERGLLGIAFHPDYATNGLFYLHYSAGQGIDGASDGDSVIEEYKVSDDPDVADPATARLVLTVDQPNGQNNHKGGTIAFGSDDLLYIGLGDGGGGGDMMGNGQNTAVLLGKILRIDPVGSGPREYTTPADNLIMTDSGAAPEVWDFGLRNPFRFGFDQCNGDLYIGDVGQDEYEEVSIEKAGEGRKNYGWNTMEALHCYGGATCDQDGITPPMIEAADAVAQSITGGAVYRGSAIPGLRGVYFYADYMKNNVWYTRYDRDANTVSTPTSISQDLNVTSVVAIRNGADGEVYFVKIGTGLSNTARPEGTIYKLESAD